MIKKMNIPSTGLCKSSHFSFSIGNNRLLQTLSKNYDAHRPGCRDSRLKVSARVRPSEEVAEKIRKAINIVTFYDALAPYDRGLFTTSGLLWNAIDDIPEEHRIDFMRDLAWHDIPKIWEMSSDRYAELTKGVHRLTRYKFTNDFPIQPGEVSYFEGRAAFLNFLGLASFKKAFLLSSTSGTAFGRTFLKYLPFVKNAYPLYYKLNTNITFVPATNEISDLSLEYLPPEDFGLEREEIRNLGWPVPKEHLYPFNGDLIDYIRPVGPGVYVGIGWKAARPEKRDIGRKFLYFVMVKNFSKDSN